MSICQNKLQLSNKTKQWMETWRKPSVTLQSTKSTNSHNLNCSGNKGAGNPALSVLEQYKKQKKKLYFKSSHCCTDIKLVCLLLLWLIWPYSEWLKSILIAAFQDRSATQTWNLSSPATLQGWNKNNGHSQKFHVWKDKQVLGRLLAFQEQE